MQFKPTNLTKKERAQIAKMKKINPDYVVGTQLDIFFNSEREVVESEVVVASGNETEVGKEIQAEFFVNE